MIRFKSTDKWSIFFSIIISLAFIGGAIIYAMSMAIHSPTFHLDGAFQTASGLFRIDFGQFPGKDFFPYLGVGPLFSLYPVFKLFGADLSASVISAYFMTVFFGWVSVSTLWHLFFRPNLFITSLSIGAVLFAIPMVVASYLFYPIPDFLSFIASPGNSLRPIRGFVPYLAAIIYYTGVSKIRSAKLKLALGGVITGFILLWSNDFAVPCAGLFAVFIMFHCFLKSGINLGNILIYSLSSLVFWIVLLNLVTLGHPLALLEYNFLDVASDQWWLFGPYGESTRIFSLAQIDRIISGENEAPLVVLFLAVIVAIKSARVEHFLIAWIGAVLFSGGVLASVGGHLGGYFGGFYFWGVITVLLAVINLIFMGGKRILNRSPRSMFKGRDVFMLITALISISVTVVALFDYKGKLISAKNNAALFYVPELGGYLGVEWLHYIDLVRKTGTNNVIEEYWGVWSATRKIPSQWPVDSVIHALGRTRVVAAETLKSSDVVISTKNLASREWQPWSLSQNFWFYSELLNNWTPREVSPTTVVWYKNNKTKNAQGIKCRIGQDGMSISLVGAMSGFYSVEMEYSFHGKERHLLLVRNNLSFGGDAGGYVSIAPDNTKAEFPVYIEHASNAVLDIKIVGRKDFDFIISSCFSRKIDFVNDDILIGPNLISSSFFLTDSNWVNGIAVRWAGFFVPNTKRFSDVYLPGRSVVFGNGDIRNIVNVASHGGYLNVYVEGELLNPVAVGLPSTFKVLKSDSSRRDYD